MVNDTSHTPANGRILDETQSSDLEKQSIGVRVDAQLFNAFNHPKLALPNSVQAGIPGVFIPAKFGMLQSTISPPTCLLGVGLGGDSSPRTLGFQARIEF
jgi:hypothetical protein